MALILPDIEEEEHRSIVHKFRPNISQTAEMWVLSIWWLDLFFPIWFIKTTPHEEHSKTKIDTTYPFVSARKFLKIYPLAMACLMMSWCQSNLHLGTMK